jgi:hypothetical protein
MADQKVVEFLLFDVFPGLGAGLLVVIENAKKGDAADHEKIQEES